MIKYLIFKYTIITAINITVFYLLARWARYSNKKK
ncbi:Uncharacterised protein [Streptobacillus moniliformis]|uniref:Uncharacterized protein n=1 Tax=Streptobacillus moniliformis (strain ATCC 14647 / DSM 12112 / NCTC 10651 / 9901) TaxID=519441 RepID=D1AV00_STRM9|nr:hypothetical protein Smon_1099 [Streptobacillus moniliformis DSM 12112]SQA13272.1 Uncharacterised protein [Streptobacillus moniliformis]